jgi:broad specificity phosphatase PhoE
MSRFITSEWKRSIQTAEILFPGSKWEIDSRIGETNPGNVSSLKKSEFKRLYPNLLKSHYNKYPGGESHSDLFNRVASWWNDLTASSNKNENIVCVAHSGSISCALQLALKLNVSFFPAFLVPNCSLSIIETYEGVSRVKLLSYCPDILQIDSLMKSYSTWP